MSFGEEGTGYALKCTDCGSTVKGSDADAVLSNAMGWTLDVECNAHYCPHCAQLPEHELCTSLYTRGLRATEVEIDDTDDIDTIAAEVQVTIESRDKQSDVAASPLARAALDDFDRLFKD